LVVVVARERDPDANFGGETAAERLCEAGPLPRTAILTERLTFGCLSAKQSSAPRPSPPGPHRW
jgi:hypothetical protein